MVQGEASRPSFRSTKARLIIILPQYNYAGSAGLDAGTCLSIIVVFLTLVLPKNGTIFLDWIGNTINEKSELGSMASNRF